MAAKDLLNSIYNETDDEAEKTKEAEERQLVPAANRNKCSSPCVDPAQSRFFRLDVYKRQALGPYLHHAENQDQRR